MKSYKLGITLMEVLASMFIICIGLLSVLMVIPYGAFQVSKARDAEYISNMLAAGAEDLQITGIVNDITEDIEPDARNRVFIIDPIITSVAGYGTGANVVFESAGSGYRDMIFGDMMYGKDDLDYVLRDGARTKIQKDVPHEQYLKQYSYFVTIKPRRDSNSFTTDLLGCYRRTNEDTIIAFTPTALGQYSRAAKLTNTGTGKLDYSTTRYVFVTWIDSGIRYGEWCKVVSVSETSGGQDIVVLTNEFVTNKNINIAEGLPTGAITVFIFPGVMYHKRIYD